MTAVETPTLFDQVPEVGTDSHGSATPPALTTAPTSDLPLDAPVRVDDPDTSVAAARQVQDTAGNDRLAVMDALHRLGGRATTDQIRAEMARAGTTRDRNCVASRISQLQKDRYGARIVDSGQRAHMAKGRPPVIVWQVT